MQTLIVDTLKVWREAERALQDLPPADPVRETVRTLAVELRSLYAKLSEAHAPSADLIARGHAQIQAAKDLLGKMREGA